MRLVQLAPPAGRYASTLHIVDGWYPGKTMCGRDATMKRRIASNDLARTCVSCERANTDRIRLREHHRGG